MQQLPKDVLLTISSFLSFADVYNLRLCCSLFARNLCFKNLFLFSRQECLMKLRLSNFVLFTLKCSSLLEQFCCRVQRVAPVLRFLFFIFYFLFFFSSIFSFLLFLLLFVFDLVLIFSCFFITFLFTSMTHSDARDCEFEWCSESYLSSRCESLFSSNFYTKSVDDLSVEVLGALSAELGELPSKERDVSSLTLRFSYIGCQNEEDVGIEVFLVKGKVVVLYSSSSNLKVYGKSCIIIRTHIITFPAYSGHYLSSGGEK